MSTIKTGAALTAQAIRKELKEKFPKAKFSVRSESFSGGDSVKISFTNSPYLEKEVEAVCDKYQYGHFNGMEDIYEYSNSRNDIPQAKFIFVDRHFTDEKRHAVVKELCEKHNIPFREDDWNIYEEIPHEHTIRRFSSVVNITLSETRF